MNSQCMYTAQGELMCTRQKQDFTEHFYAQNAPNVIPKQGFKTEYKDFFGKNLKNCKLENNAVKCQVVTKQGKPQVNPKCRLNSYTKKKTCDGTKPAKGCSKDSDCPATTAAVPEELSPFFTFVPPQCTECRESYNTANSEQKGTYVDSIACKCEGKDYPGFLNYAIRYNKGNGGLTFKSGKVGGTVIEECLKNPAKGISVGDFSVGRDTVRGIAC